MEFKSDLKQLGANYQALSVLQGQRFQNLIEGFYISRIMIMISCFILSQCPYVCSDNVEMKYNKPNEIIKMQE